MIRSLYENWTDARKKRDDKQESWRLFLIHAGSSPKGDRRMREFSRRPQSPIQWLAFVGGCAAIVLFLASLVPGPPAWTPPPTPAAAFFWPANSNPIAMCRHDDGVSQILATGNATEADPLPAGSSVACNDGAVISVVLP